MSLKNDAFYRLGLRVLGKLPSDGHGRTLLITSARAGEGKSFVAKALAQALAAQCSGPVALLQAASEASTGKGWSDLVNQGQWDDNMSHKGSVDNLHLIGAGSAPRAETLFKPDAVHQALQLLREQFSMVVIDAPSLGECGALPRHADGTLLVINAKDTRREVVQGSLVANPIPADKLLGTVLNQRPEYVPSWLYRWML